MRYRMIGPVRGGRVTAVTGVPSEPNTFYMWARLVEASGKLPTPVIPGTTSPMAFSPLPPWAQSKFLLSGPEYHLRRHRQLQNPAATCLSDMAYINQAMPAKPGNSQASATPAKSRPSAFIRRIRGSPTSPRSAILSSLIPTAASIKQPTEARLGARCSTCRTSSEQPIWNCSPAAPMSYSPACGSASASRGPSWSGAKEGGIYKSTDGGDTWNKLTNGLPGELFGRANVAISNSKPNRIYALIEAKPGSGLYRSEDAGANWSLINNSGTLITRPFYYDTLGVDPNNSDVVWIGNEGWDQIDRRRQEFPHFTCPSRRQSRCLDQFQKFRLHDPVQRRRGQRLTRWRTHLERANQPADG